MHFAEILVESVWVDGRRQTGSDEFLVMSCEWDLQEFEACRLSSVALAQGDSPKSWQSPEPVTFWSRFFREPGTVDGGLKSEDLTASGVMSYECLVFSV